jgi:hypothetical protein
VSTHARAANPPSSCLVRTNCNVSSSFPANLLQVVNSIRWLGTAIVGTSTTHSGGKNWILYKTLNFLGAPVLL